VWCRVANGQDMHGVRADGKQNPMRGTSAETEIQHADFAAMFGISASWRTALGGFFS